MKTKTKAILCALLLMVSLFLAACPKRESIASIEADPSKYNGREVAVAGTVENGFGASIPFTNIRGGVYRVNDGTGQIWVLTKLDVPPKGAKIGVKGKVQNGLNYNGKNYGLGLIEEDRKVK